MHVERVQKPLAKMPGGIWYLQSKGAAHPNPLTIWVRTSGEIKYGWPKIKESRDGKAYEVYCEADRPNGPDFWSVMIFALRVVIEPGCQGMRGKTILEIPM
ncbi:MAG: hypothetical protein AAB597_03630 [Patescibacteria group bacterium]